MSGPRCLRSRLVSAVLLLACAASGVLLHACFRSEPTAGGNSNWLRVCDRDADCNDGNSCICGRCTSECAADNECSDYHRRATCQPAGMLDPRCQISNVCVLRCDAEIECAQRLGAGAACEGQVCAPPSPSNVDTRENEEPPRPAPPPMPGGPISEGLVTRPDDPARCEAKGLDLDGLTHSPGGALLPYPCRPFHPTLNNPYAVRCVDAWPWYDTGFPGDEYCILPPEPGQGIQYGVHPQGADWHAQVSTGDMGGYERANIPDGFVVPAGHEDAPTYVTSTPNTETGNYYRHQMRMRTGSHHMIAYARAGMPQDVREAWGRGVISDERINLPGAVRSAQNTPQGPSRPPEDDGLYQAIGPDLTLSIDVHHFNQTDADQLRETWTNLWWTQETRVRMHRVFGFPIGQSASSFARPGETQNYHASWKLDSDIRLLDLGAHRHAWTSNFSVWVERPDGSVEVLYQSFDWRDPPTFRYDSLTTNPVAQPDRLVDGGSSGVQQLTAGDELHFNCHIVYTPERAAAEGLPEPTVPLRFQPGTHAGEACVLFGSTAGGDLGTPDEHPGSPPPFATTE